MNTKIRLVDIAKQSGTSLAAVSKILGGSRCSSIGVRKEKADLIRKIAAENHYVANVHARALHGQSIKLLGVLVDSQQAPVMSRLLSNIEHHATQRGYQIIVGEAHNSIESLHDTYSVLKQQGVDGVICMSHDYPSHGKKLAELFRDEKNIVFQDTPKLKNPYACVNLELESGIKEAIKYLRAGGRTNIGLICGHQVKAKTTQARLNAYRALVPAEKQRVWILKDEKGHSILKEEMQRAVSSFVIPEKLDALVMYNDLHAIAMLGILARAGIRVPEQISVIGCDNEPFGEFCNPSLTTIDQNMALVAGSMVDLLLDVIKSQSGEKITRTISIKPKLVRRESA